MRLLPALISLLAVVVAAAPAAAAPPAQPPPCPRPIEFTDTSGRVVRGTSGEGATADSWLAVLPSRYAARPKRRYPVVYLCMAMTPGPRSSSPASACSSCPGATT